MNEEHINNFLFCLSFSSSCLFTVPTLFRKKELHWENWQCLWVTKILMSGDIWEVATWRQLSNLSPSSLFSFCSSQYSSLKNISATKTLIICSVWLLCAENVTGGKKSLQQWRCVASHNYFLGFCMNADKIIVHQISYLFVSCFWN